MMNESSVLNYRLIAISIMAGCSEYNVPMVDIDTNAAESSSAYASSSRVWDPGAISVCFTTTPPQQADGREQIQKAVEDTYGFWSGLSFTGWGLCSSATSGAADIKIENPLFGENIFSKFGTDSPSYYPSMRLHVDNSGGCSPYVEALHEFAHAVALYHEHDRTLDPHGDGVSFGSYDQYSASLITYVTEGGSGISQKDADFLQYYYPGLGAGASFYFDPQYYFANNPDLVAVLGATPTTLELKTHWVTQGLRDCRRASENFDPEFYVRANEARLAADRYLGGTGCHSVGGDLALGDGGCFGGVVQHQRDKDSSFTTPEISSALLVSSVFSVVQ